MGALMDLVGGDAREILLAIGVEDWAGLRDPTRFDACISLGGAMDPTWLDLFSQAAREVGGAGSPAPFTDCARPLDGRQAALSERVVERVDPDWVELVALLPEAWHDRIASRWIELVDSEIDLVGAADKPMLRDLVGGLVAFCRDADGAEDVLLVWTL